MEESDERTDLSPIMLLKNETPDACPLVGKDAGPTGGIDITADASGMAGASRGGMADGASVTMNSKVGWKVEACAELSTVQRELVRV